MEQAYIGPGRAIDPVKYFVIIANQIGNGLSSSPHNTSAPFNGIKFPHVRISDDVRAQHKLITASPGVFTLKTPNFYRFGALGIFSHYGNRKG
jgi:homoserine O-acetyltransferase